MLDMHAHILPGIDDGPKTMAESIELLEIVEGEGVSDIIVTPHAYSPHYNVSKQQVFEGLELVKKEMKEKELTIQLHAGQEVRIHDEIVERVANGEALTLAGSKYVLLELPSSGIPAYTVPVIQGLLNLNIVPIIAHPERNRAIADKPSRLGRLVTHGALSQITAGSLAGYFGKNVQKLSLQLVKANLVHTYGSDVHNKETRPALFEQGLDVLDQRGYHDIADILLENNARIVKNKEFILLEPNPIEKKKWWHFR